MQEILHPIPTGFDGRFAMAAVSVLSRVEFMQHLQAGVIQVDRATAEKICSRLDLAEPDDLQLMMLMMSFLDRESVHALFSNIKETEVPEAKRWVEEKQLLSLLGV